MPEPGGRAAADFDAGVASASLLHAGRRVPIPANGLTIGRAEDSDLVLDSRRASREHAVLELHERGGFSLTDLSFPAGITTGPNGTPWFTEGEGETAGEAAGRLGEINPTTDATRDFEFSPKSGQHSPGEITRGREGNLWFTELFRGTNGAIGEINPNTHKIAEFENPTPGGTPLGITTGEEGNLWYTEIGASKVGRLNPSTHKIQEFELAPGSGPSGITLGEEGNLWFAEHEAGKIGTIGTGHHPRHHRRR